MDYRSLSAAISTNRRAERSDMALHAQLFDRLVCPFEFSLLVCGECVVVCNCAAHILYHTAGLGQIVFTKPYLACLFSEWVYYIFPHWFGSEYNANFQSKANIETLIRIFQCCFSDVFYKYFENVAFNFQICGLFNDVGQ